MDAPEPVMDLAHLGHVELLTPKPEQSLAFFRDVMGMTVSGTKGDSVFLRGWDDYERYSLQLTASTTSGLGHAAFRTRSAAALERRLAALRAEGCDVIRVDSNFGHGPAWRFRDPDGHVFELYWETEWYDAPADRRASLKNQAERYPARGVNVRRIDHFNCLAVDVRACREFFERTLGLRCTERIELDSGEEAGMWLTCTNRPLPPPHLRARQPRGHPPGGGHLPRGGRLHRDGPAQARRAADLLPLRLRAWRQPHRGRARRRAAYSGTRLEDDHLDGGRAEEGPGLGPADHPLLPHPRHAAAARGDGRVTRAAGTSAFIAPAREPLP
ncbi:MAG: VOC family protein [Rubritepida sp.]|nr:VOC family protein [Rubritepida sp.]